LLWGKEGLAATVNDRERKCGGADECAEDQIRKQGTDAANFLSGEERIKK